MSANILQCPLGDRSLLAGDCYSRMSRGVSSRFIIIRSPDNQLLGNRIGISCLLGPRKDGNDPEDEDLLRQDRPAPREMQRMPGREKGKIRLFCFV